MKIEIKNIKYSAFASHETHCFQATVFIDGVKAGTVANDGQGGSNSYYPRGLQEKLDDYGATLPPIYYDTMPGQLDYAVTQNADTLIGDLMNDWLVQRDIKRLTKTKVLYTRTDEKGLWNWALCDKAAHAALVARGEAAVRENLTYADKILNFLPIAEAMNIYRNNAR